jgi:Ca2+-dependent lipid-binding protein
MLSGEPLDTAIGVLKVSIHSARGLKGVKIGGGAPDPYVALSIGQRSTLANTRWKQST